LGLSPKARREMDFKHKRTASQRINQRKEHMNHTQLATTETQIADPIVRHKTNLALAKAVRDSVEQETIEVMGHRYIKNPGWLIMAGAAGYVVSGGEVKREGDGFIAKAYLRRSDNGVIVAEAEGFCSKDEKRWKHADEYAVRSMAQTRAASKVCKMALAACVPLMGIKNLSATPADEVPPGGFQDINTDKYEEPTAAEVKEITAQLVEEKKTKDSEIKDMTVSFGKYKGQTVRQIARSAEGFGWLMWLNEQPLKNAPDGQPYKKDVALRAVIKAVIEEDKKDEIPF